MDAQTAKLFPDWRRSLWLAALVITSVVFTLGIACAVPFAALGAAAALTLPRRDALWLTGGVWLANQIVGYAVLGYPWTADCIAWTFILGGIALLSTVTPQALMPRLAGQNAVVTAVACFAAAFLVYEGGLYLISVSVMGGSDIYDFPTVTRILEINAAACGGLLGLHYLGAALRPVIMPVLARP
jgi:hypothetical protein